MAKLYSVHGRCLSHYYDEESGLTLWAGQKVGAGRWPYIHVHPDGWAPPHCGIVLPLNHVLVWRHTMWANSKFKASDIPQEAIDEHVARCILDGLFPPNRVPVLWLFYRNERKVFISKMGMDVNDVKPYELDLQMWLKAKYEALERWKTA